MQPPPEDPNARSDSPQEFSLEQRIPHPPLPGQHNSRLILWCRIILWISTGPTWAILSIGIAWLGYSHLATNIGLAVFCAVSIGYCDAFLSPDVLKKNGIPEPSAAVTHCLIFSSIQILFAPLVLCIVGVFMFLTLRYA